MVSMSRSMRAVAVIPCSFCGCSAAPRILTCESTPGGCRDGDCGLGNAGVARRDFLNVRDELSGARLPRPIERERAARVARHPQRIEARRAQVLVQCANRTAADDILRPGYRK